MTQAAVVIPLNEIVRDEVSGYSILEYEEVVFMADYVWEFVGERMFV